MNVIQREISKSIKDLIAKYPILALTGTKQSGKTTLLKNLFESYRYVSLEDPDIREYAQDDPKGFLNEYHDEVIFDEVQRVPQLF